jgi:hypothetical protein
MKKLSNIFFVVAVALAITSCIENEPVVFTNSKAEFDAAVWNTPAAGETFPILTRIPGFGRAVSTNATAPSTPDPLINRTVGTVSYRVNLVGPPAVTDQSLAVSVVSEKSTAIEGTHYARPTEVMINAGENFGTLSLQVINPGVASATPVVLVLQIDGNSTVEPSENYKRIGMSIAQN